MDKNDLKSQLFEAVEANNIDFIRDKITAGLSLKDFTNSAKDTLLIVAAQHNHADMLKLLIKTDIPIDQVNKFGFSALLSAANFNHLEIVEILLKNNAAVNIANQYDLTPLIFAILNKNAQMVKILVDAGANLDQFSAGFTPLFTAMQISHQFNTDTKIIEILVEAGAKPDLKVKGITHLGFAYFINSLANVKILLAAGASAEENLKIYVSEDEEISKRVEIAKEIDLYKQNPIDYILKHNSKAKLALKAMKNLKEQDSFLIKMAIGTSTFSEFNYAKSVQCLQAQPQLEDLNLDLICGQNKTYYSPFAS